MKFFFWNLKIYQKWGVVQSFDFFKILTPSVSYFELKCLCSNFNHSKTFLFLSFELWKKILLYKGTKIQLFYFMKFFCLCKQKIGFVYISKNLTFEWFHGFCRPIRLFWSTFYFWQLLFKKFLWFKPLNIVMLQT